LLSLNDKISSIGLLIKEQKRNSLACFVTGNIKIQVEIIAKIFAYIREPFYKPLSFRCQKRVPITLCF
jgi:hypothetical protein